MMMKRLSLAGATLLSASFGSAVQAQEIDPDPRFWLEGGVYLPNANTDITLSTPDGTRGTTISLEDDLGFETDATSVDLTFGAKFDDEFFGELSYFAIDRTTSVTLDQQIVVEDVTYDVGANVESTFGSDIIRASLGFRLVANEKWDLAVLVGAHTTQFDFEISGDGVVNGQAGTAVRRARDVLAPLPTLGLQAQFRPIKWLQLRARADYFELEIDKYDGRLTNLEASATAAVTKNIGLGLAWRLTDYRLTVDDEDYLGVISYELDGVRLFARVTF